MWIKVCYFWSCKTIFFRYINGDIFVMLSLHAIVIQAHPLWLWDFWIYGDLKWYFSSDAAICTLSFLFIYCNLVCACSNAEVLFFIYTVALHIWTVFMKGNCPAIAVLFLVCIVFRKYKNSTLCPLITLYFYIILCPWRFNYWLNIVDLCDHSVPPDLKSGGNTENMHPSVPLNAIMRWKDSQDWNGCFSYLVYLLFLQSN